MSLINQMLNDLDSRHADAGEARVANDVRALPAQRRTSRWPLLAAGLAGALGVAVWAWLGVRSPAVQVAAVNPEPLPAAPAVVPAAAGSAAGQPNAPGLPALAVPPMTPPAVAPAVVAATEAVSSAPPAVAPGNSAGREATPGGTMEPALRLAQRVTQPRPEAGASPSTSPTAAAIPTQAPAAVAEASTPADSGKIARQARLPSQAERSEANYRAALAHLNQGRVDDAVATLRTVLHEEPGHQPSRQLLLKLLIEARAYDELRTVLEAGLERSPQQLPWALLLSRLLADKGENEAALKVLRAPALEALGGSELRGATAAILQRLGRHAEAEAQYAEALRLDARDARWWVGLAIAAEAQGKPGREMFLRARELGGLSAELQAFVDQKLR